MITFLFSLIIFSLVMLGMSLGYIVKRKSLTGSCGGLANLPGATSGCEGCKKRCNKASSSNPKEH